MLALVAPEDAAGRFSFCPSLGFAGRRVTAWSSLRHLSSEPGCLLSPATGCSGDHKCARALIAGRPGALRLGVGRLVAEIVQRMNVSTSGWCTSFAFRVHGHFDAACCLADAP